MVKAVKDRYEDQSYYSIAYLNFGKFNQKFPFTSESDNEIHRRI